jgi:hypothetical protein
VQGIHGILMYETIRDEMEHAAGGERWVFPDGRAAVSLPQFVVASDEARVIIAFEEKSGPIPVEVQSSARAVIGHFDASLWGSSSDTAPAPSR